MKHVIMRVAGIALIVAGVAGLIFSIVALILLARIAGQAESAITEQMERVNRTLKTTAEGLVLAETSIGQATDTLAAMADTAAGAGKAVTGAAPTIEAVSELVGEQLPATIESIQETLRSAATSAKLVDDILTAMSTVPLLGTTRYNPDVPLHQGLEEIAASLDEIPTSLSTAQEGLTYASGDLQGLGEDFGSMAGNINQIGASLESAQSVLQQYQDIVTDLQELVGWVQESLPTWLRLIRVGISLFLVWLGFVQIALIAQGLDLIERSRPTVGEGR